MEPEFCQMASGRVTVHSSRLRLTEVTPESLLKMEEDLERAIVELVDAEVDVVIFGCTSGSLVGGPEYDLKLERKMEALGRRQVVTTATAVVQAIKAVGMSKIGVATPYTEEVNELERFFLEGNGIGVLNMEGLGLVNNVDIGRSDPSVACRLARSVDAPGADGIFISCTNFRTATVIERLEQDIGKPVVTSTQASLWAALLRAEVFGPIEGYGALLREHIPPESVGD